MLNTVSAVEVGAGTSAAIVGLPEVVDPTTNPNLYIGAGLLILAGVLVVDALRRPRVSETTTPDN